MMPFNKERNRRIYIAALVISFLLIVGSIYLHLKQKTHLGRMSFNLDRDLVKPTSGVEITTWIKQYESKKFQYTNEHVSDQDINQEQDILKTSSTEDNNDYSITYGGFGPPESNKDIIEDADADGERYKDEQMDNLNDDNDGNIDDIYRIAKKNSEYKLKSLQQDSTACLRCVCMAVNECRPTFCGSGNPCGLYRISKTYWIDAGKPTIAGGTTDNEDQDYLTCVNEDNCATTVIRQYYNRYKRDCNKDGTFDCRDQIALHFLGPTDCLTENLSYIHANRMKNCLIESNLNNFSYSSEEEY